MGVTQTSTTCDSAMTLATEKDAVRSRLGELHRLLNNRKGSPSVTYKKNAEANNRAHDMNQKSVQALDTLAEQYEAFEVTMKNVTNEHEKEDVLYAVASPEGPGPSTGRTGLLLRRSGHFFQGILKLLGRT